ncbi:hypothetical protein, partial [Enterococcus faecium]|uniref:hypothetical protein n=1 Tax=Enterococcus faecium TaxID=1352 RepID=UPI003F43A9D1
AQAGVREVYHHLGHSYFSAKDKDREKELERAIAYFSERLRRLENAEPMRGSELGRAYAQRGRAYQLRNKSGDLASAVKDYTAALARNS